MPPQVETFFHTGTNTFTHIVKDPESSSVAIIDPVLDYDVKSGRTSTEFADKLLAYVAEKELVVEWLLETHIHADHLTAAPYLKEKTGAKTGVGAHIKDVQDTWNSIFNYRDGMETDPDSFDVLFDEGSHFKIGGLDVETLYTPGHTNVDMTYLIGQSAFVGDTLFMPDFGTARTDFPGGDARTLYRSIKRILSLPPETVIYLCHDYLPKGRDEYVCTTTVAEEREKNIHISTMDEDEFVEMREGRDSTLAVPALLYPSIQVNIRAGESPPPEENGVSYIKIPISEA